MHDIEQFFAESPSQNRTVAGFEVVIDFTVESDETQTVASLPDRPRIT